MLLSSHSGGIDVQRVTIQASYLLEYSRGLALVLLDLGSHFMSNGSFSLPHFLLSNRCISSPNLLSQSTHEATHSFQVFHLHSIISVFVVAFSRVTMLPRNYVRRSQVPASLEKHSSVTRLDKHVYQADMTKSFCVVSGMLHFKNSG